MKISHTEAPKFMELFRNLLSVLCKARVENELTEEEYQNEYEKLVHRFYEASIGEKVRNV